MKKKVKILNLYASLGGNAYKWNREEVEVTAVELDKELCKLYKKRFPKDKVICSDAHAFLLELAQNNNINEFDFIWSSPPCPSHSRARRANKKAKVIYPDLKLYEEVILLQHNYKGLYCIENVIPYYNKCKPLLNAHKRGRHIYFTNFTLPEILSNRKRAKIGDNSKDEIKNLVKFHEIEEEYKAYKGKQRKDKIARNLVDFEAGLTILESALKEMKIKEEIKNFKAELF